MAVAEAGTAEEYMQTAMETAVAKAAAAVTAVEAAAGMTCSRTCATRLPVEKGEVVESAFEVSDFKKK